MARIVVMGAGIGGIPFACEAREKLGKAHDITVVKASEELQFLPSNPCAGAAISSIRSVSTAKNGWSKTDTDASNRGAAGLLHGRVARRRPHGKPFFKRIRGYTKLINTHGV